MSITNNVGCHEAGCPAFLNEGCPSELRLTDSSGKVVGCKSSCGWDGQTGASSSPGSDFWLFADARRVQKTPPAAALEAMTLRKPVPHPA